MTMTPTDAEALLIDALADLDVTPADLDHLRRTLRAICALPAGLGPLAGLRADLLAAADVLDDH